MIGSYDPYNKAYMSGKEPDNFTLSMVDLTYVKPAYEKLNTLFDKQREAIKERESDYVDISSTARNSYIFGNDEQIAAFHGVPIASIPAVRVSEEHASVVEEEVQDALSHVPPAGTDLPDVLVHFPGPFSWQRLPRGAVVPAALGVT